MSGYGVFKASGLEWPEIPPNVCVSLRGQLKQLPKAYFSISTLRAYLSKNLGIFLEFIKNVLEFQASLRRRVTSFMAQYSEKL